MRFTKMQGAGNDFILINNIEEQIPEAQMGALAKRLCTRRISIGADGVMFVDKARADGDYRMIFYNADGGEAEMCGNGARCIARYGYEKGLAGPVQQIETASGLVTGRRIGPSLYELQLAEPSVLELHRPVEAMGQLWDCGYVELGSPGLPHAVLMLEDWDERPREALFALGQALRQHESFPKGANVSFVKMLSPNDFKAITFERGVEDFTLACGTGCGAIALVTTLRGWASGHDTRIRMPGGELYVNFTREPQPHTLLLTGPTVMVCEGDIIDM